MHLDMYGSPGLWWGAAGGIAYVLAEFIADCRNDFPEGRGRLYLAQAIARVILGAIVGAATVMLGTGSAFVAGLAGPAALVALGARFGRRGPRRGKREALPNADDPADTKPGT